MSMKALWMLPCLALALSGADVTGKWSGSIDVNDPSDGSLIRTPVRAEFQQKESALLGRIGRKQDESSEEIRNGRVEGSRISFEVVSPETTGVIKFTLTLEGDRITGEMRGNLDVGPITGKVLLNRET